METIQLWLLLRPNPPYPQLYISGPLNSGIFVYLEHLEFCFLDISNLISRSLFHKKAYPKYRNLILFKSCNSIFKFQAINGFGWRSTVEGRHSSCRVRTNEHLRFQNPGSHSNIRQELLYSSRVAIPIHIASLTSLGHRQKARRIKADLKRKVANQLIVSSSVPQPLPISKKTIN